LKIEEAEYRRGVDELTDADLNDLIIFWSKWVKKSDLLTVKCNLVLSVRSLPAQWK
jgi:hypothetical protein